jgi:hypothetical protein
MNANSRPVKRVLIDPVLVNPEAGVRQQTIEHGKALVAIPAGKRVIFCPNLFFVVGCVAPGPEVHGRTSDKAVHPNDNRGRRSQVGRNDDENLVPSSMFSLNPHDLDPHPVL